MGRATCQRPGGESDSFIHGTGHFHAFALGVMKVKA